MMRDDPIVEEIRQLRKQHTEKFKGNLHAICEDLRSQERESGREYTALSPRPVANQCLSAASRT
jgi:hypothetical protein